MVASISQRIAESGIVAIIRGTDLETAIETVDALRRGGVSTVDITANTEGVLDMIRDVSESFAADEGNTASQIGHEQKDCPQT